MIVYNVTKKKDAYQKMEDFLNQEEDFDVLFLGTSHVKNGISPMQLWDEYGIVSYNLGNSTETIAASYHNMLLALKETNPKLVVIDTYYAIYETKIKEDKEALLHDVFDAYPLSYTKYLAIKDLFNGENVIDNSIKHLFNFSIYHSRWHELTENDFIVKKQFNKGAEDLVGIGTPIETDEQTLGNNPKKEETVNMKYLRKIIEYCQQNDIQILVTYLPHPARPVQILLAKYIQRICNEYDVNYINLLDKNIVDYDIESYDEDSHINVSGMRKVTSYIGKYIVNNYKILDQRKNKAYSFWNKDYDEYVDYKINMLKENETNLNNYLVLLYGEKDINYKIEISSEKEIEEGTILYKLLENLGNNYQIIDEIFDEENVEKTVKITTWDNRDNSLINTVWWE